MCKSGFEESTKDRMTDDWDEYLDTDDEDGNECYPRRSMEETERIRAKQDFELQSAYRRSKHRILQANFQEEQRNIRFIRLIPEPSVTPVAIRKRLLKQKTTSNCPYIDYEAIDVDDMRSPGRYEADCSDCENSFDAMPMADENVPEEDSLASLQKPSSKAATGVGFAAFSHSTNNFESDDSSDCLKKYSLKNGTCVRRGCVTCDDGPIGNQKGRSTESVHTDDSFESDEESFESDEETSVESHPKPFSKSATSHQSGRCGTSLVVSIDSDGILESDEDSVFG